MTAQKTEKEEKIRLSFDPEKQTEIILKASPNERMLDILVRRYGLDPTIPPHTLEQIGQKYGITRERVRQIENQAIEMLRRSEEYKQISDALNELSALIEESGGVIPERDLVELLDLPEHTKRHILFLLTLGDFKKHKDTAEFHSHWYKDESHARTVREAIRRLARELDPYTVLPENEILQRYISHLNALEKQIEDEKKALRHLIISKLIAQNSLGEWGLYDSPLIRIRGVKDYAYLALKRHGSPMHFREVAEKIKELFGKDANPVTVHNELIKDDRFVLVGKGIYALSEWGYKKGPVKEIIKDILQKEGRPMSKEEIIERVKRERYVQDGTIAINLADTDLFEKTESGLYVLKTNKKEDKANAEKEKTKKSSTSKKTSASKKSSSKKSSTKEKSSTNTKNKKA